MSAPENNICFRINDKKFIVNAGQTENSTPTSLLVDFIRNEAGLTGTKFMCREGGCGACVVTVKIKDPVTGQSKSAAVNSCLIPVYSCDGWEISTVEKLGNHKDGYDIIQNRLVGFSGTQCGYCSPGMVMNMYGLMKSNPNLTAKEIEDSFDGNICRCTGFRPIMDAFKSLAIDVPDAIKKKCEEMEELTGKQCPLKESCCKAGKCLKNGPTTNGEVAIEDCCNNRNPNLHLKVPTGQRWVKPSSLKETLEFLRDFSTQGVKYRIVAGNTSTGIYKNDGPFTAYLDVNGIHDLKKHAVGADHVSFGAGTTLSAAITLLKKIAQLSGFEYGTELAKHWHRVANTPVRNMGTIAGNLMIKHVHHEFPSDIFITLEGIGAKITIASHAGTVKSYSLVEFLKINMTGNLIISIDLPPLPKSAGYVVRSFKITRRYQNSHAYVNGCLTFKLDSSFNVVEQPRICFGGINPSFVHATSTASFFTGKSIKTSTVVQEALLILGKELVPDFRPPDAAPEYRKNLARNLLYKTILGILGPNINAKFSSGGTNLEHKVSSGKQTYDSYREQWPLTKPIPKLEAAFQCSGEAEYVNDIPRLHNELYGAFVVSKVANADLKGIDASEALKIPGVVSFVSAKDIPGNNNYLVLMPFPTQCDQEIFVKETVRAAGQPVGLILAETRAAAFEAVKHVKVNYANIKKPVLGIENAIAKAKSEGIFEKFFLPPTKSSIEPPASTKHKISGEFALNSQAHFPMEPQVTLCVPKEGGMDVYSATQYMDQVQVCIAEMLQLPNNTINVQVRRLGGAFGAKASPATHVAAACAMGAHVTNRPVRIVVDLETNMAMVGKRTPYYCIYETGFDDNGKIQSMDAKIIADSGALTNEPDVFLGVALFQNAYDSAGWQIAGGFVNTNTVPNTYCRAPGTPDGVASIEAVIEHIAYYLKKDPLEIRLNNLIKSGGELIGVAGVFPSETFEGENVIERLVEEMKSGASYEERKSDVAAFNKANRWRKRGLSIVPMRYPQHIFMTAYPSYLAVYHKDGTIAICHGGIEMGQGINTKAAQVVAHCLNVPLEKIKIKPANNLVSANGNITAGAMTSELMAYSLHKACGVLLERIAPVRAKLGESASWEEIVAACHAQGMDLKASYLPSAADNIKPYSIWGLTLTEVELDVLTGEYKIVRMDSWEDAGKSVSPEVDIGQVEGSLIMGLGLWTLEKLQYDEETGEILTNNTWEYKPPLPKDIPEDLRVHLLANSPNPVQIHGSKATGEPPLCMSIGVVFALKQAITSARADLGNFEHYHVETPLTPEGILKYCLTSNEHLQL